MHNLTDKQLDFLKNERKVLRKQFANACKEKGFNSIEARYFDGKSDGLLETLLYLGVTLQELNS